MNAREVALLVVRDVFPSPGDALERGAQEALDYRLRRSDLEPRDRAFATELAYGAIKMRRALDWYLAPFLGDRVKTLAHAIREVLRLAVYELVYTRADEHAAVFEWVNVAKRYGHRGTTGLVNAVLRSFLRERPPEPAREHFDDDDTYLGTRHSLPTWLVRQWRVMFASDEAGEGRLEAICAAVNEPARACATVNRMRAPVEDVLDAFTGAGLHARRSAFVEESLLVDEPGALHARESAASGGWWVQSESSAMAVDVLNPQPGEAVLDVCSGRGNKALQIGARMAGDGTLHCLERDERKAGVLGERLIEAGMAASVVVGDATAVELAPGLRFDRVLVDAPCSGVGVVGRHPEARWRKRPDDGLRLAATQRALLEAMAARVFAGGALVYAVCSTDPRETREVVDAFVRANGFERGLIPDRYEPFLTEQGDVLVPPGIEGRDGFYIARLERPA